MKPEETTKEQLLNAVGESINKSNKIASDNFKSEIAKLQNKILSDSFYIKALEEELRLAKEVIKQKGLINALKNIQP